MTDRRRYDSPRRRSQADATRANIAAAARHLFVTRGWAGTRMRDVAEAAGVAEPTVFAAYGSKARLAAALVDAVVDEADAEHQEVQIAAAAGDPSRQLAAMVAFDRRLFERGGDVLGLLAEAGPSQPELAAAYGSGREGADALRREVMGTWPARAWRQGVDLTTGVDTYAALCNVGTYRLLTGERSWPADRVEAWWLDSLILLLLR